MDEPFRKDLGSTSWETVFARQAQRGALVQEWLAELEVRAGEHVLDIGAGPGYVSVQAAIRVGADGLVLAVDRSADALAYLERQQQTRGIAHIRRIVADATTMDPLDEHVDVVLVTMMLHHVDDPAGLIQHVARLVPEGTRAVVAEFHPDGPCLEGPPRAHRLRPEQVQRWCKYADFLPLRYRRQSPEHYMLLVKRGHAG